MREVIGDVAVVTSGNEPTVTRVWRYLPDGRVGALLAEFVTFGRREGSAQHAKAVRQAKAGAYAAQPAVQGAA